MGLANLYLPQPGREGWETFWFNNWIDHQDIQQAIQKKYSVNQTVYVIDPWVDFDANGILQRHQQYHNDMNSVLGLSGSDLSSINFKDQEAVKSWCFTHYLDHQSVRLVLPI